MSTLLKIIPELCIGCRSCELACSLENENIMAVSGSRINVISFIESRAYGMPYHLPVTCYQCADAPCVNVCPEGALNRDQNAVHLDMDKCTVCGQCIKACPFGLIRHDKVLKKIVKCELCDGSPVCVEICPSEAILFEASEPFNARKKTFETLAYRALKKTKNKAYNQSL